MPPSWSLHIRFPLLLVFFHLSALSSLSPESPPGPLSQVGSPPADSPPPSLVQLRSPRPLRREHQSPGSAVHAPFGLLRGRWVKAGGALESLFPPPPGPGNIYGPLGAGEGGVGSSPRHALESPVVPAGDRSAERAGIPQPQSVSAADKKVTAAWKPRASAVSFHAGRGGAGGRCGAHRCYTRAFLLSELGEIQRTYLAENRLS